MKVLCAASPQLPISVMKGWANALGLAGFEFVLWDARIKPIFDAFDENEPDIFISTVNDVSRGMANCLEEYSETKSIFYSPSWESITEENKQYMSMLRTDTGKPDAIFSFCHKSHLHQVIGGWSNDYPIISLMKAADPVRFPKTKMEDMWKSDIAIADDYKEHLSDFILPLCHRDFRERLKTKIKVRIFGEGWPVAQGLGTPVDANLKNIFASAHMVIDVAKHDYEPSDVPFNVALAGGFCLSNSFSEIFPNNKEFPHFENPVELQQLVKYYHGQPMLNRVGDASRRDILAEHTYSHRMVDLLNFLGFEDEANELGETPYEIS